MKQIIGLIMTFLLIPRLSMADCTFSDLVHNSDGTVTYSKADHICVGQLAQDNATKTQQIQDYVKAITLKDMALSDADKRTQLWIDTSLKLESNIQSIDSYKNTSNWIYFGLGVLTVVGAGFALSSITIRH